LRKIYTKWTINLRDLMLKNIDQIL